VTLTFRNIHDGDRMPAHVFRADGNIDGAALLKWCCPSLSLEEAERIASMPDAPITATSVGAIRALIQRHHR
jgi:hypothetical protein